MPDYPRAKPGDPLVVPAAAYNEFLDGAAERRRRRGVQGAAVAQADFDPAVILVKNTTGAALDRFAVVGLNGPAIDPADNPDGFKQAVMMLGRAPVLPDDAGRFAVLIGPLPDGQAGYAAIAGACPVQVDVADAGDTFADVTAGVTDKLTSGGSGMQILWKPAGTGVKWCVVRLGGGGAADTGAGQYYGQVRYTGADLAAAWGFVPVVNRPPV